MHRTVYRLLRLVIDLLVLRGRRDRSNDAEILVLRHQVTILSRQTPRPRFTPEDRGFLAGPAPEVAVFDPGRAIQKRTVCGGLINEYRQAA